MGMNEREWTVEQRNMRSLTYKKVRSFNKRNEQDKPEILCLQETWRTDKESESSANALVGYTMYHHERQQPKNRSAGGVAIYIKNSPHVFHERVSKTDETTMTESLTVKVTHATDSTRDTIYVTCAYIRSKDYVNEENVSSSVPIIPDDARHIVCADFNAHNDLWDHAYTPTTTNAAAGQCVLDWALEQGYDFANDPDLHTYRNVSKKSSVISSPDVTLFKNAQVFDWKTHMDMESDHARISFKLQGERNQYGSPLKKARWNMNKANWIGFRTELEEKLRPDSGITAAKFSEMLFSSGLRHIPRGVHKNFKPLWTKAMSEADANVREQEAALNEMNVKSEEYIAAFTHLREIHKLRDEIHRSEMRRVFREKVEKLQLGNREAWQCIRNQAPSTQPARGKTMFKDKARQQVLKTNKEKAKAFVEKYQRTASRHPAAQPPPKVDVKDATLAPITMEELRNAIRRLRNGRAPGPDCIPGEFLKHLGHNGRTVLLEIANRSLRTGDIYQKWKMGMIIPLLKPNKDNTQIDSYRPVTLTCHVSKMLERIIATRVIHKVAHKLHHGQYGFRKGKSTIDALAELLEYVCEAQDTYEQTMYTNRKVPRKGWAFQRVCMIMVDFSSAFDTIDHSAIMEYLIKLGVGAYERRWIRSFLTRRLNQVSYEDATSTPTEFTSGVPQGTVLGPLLFILAMDPLLKTLSKLPNLNVAYADDLTIAAKSLYVKDVIPQLQLAMDAIAEWTKWSRMKVNVTKTSGLIFSHSPEQKFDDISDDPLFYGLGNDKKEVTIIKTPTEEYPNPKLLGLYLHHRTSFVEQATKSRKKCQDARRILSKLQGPTFGFKRKDARCYADAFCGTKMTYGMLLYHHYLEPNQQELIDQAYRTNLKCSLGVSKRACSVGTHLETNTLPLSLQIQQMSALNLERMRRIPGPQQQLAQKDPLQPHPRKDHFKPSPLQPARDFLRRAYTWAGIAPDHPVDTIVTCNPINPAATSGWDRIHIHHKLGTKKKTSYTKKQQLDLVEERITALGEFDLTIYTDGSSHVKLKCEKPTKAGAATIIFDSRNGKLEEISRHQAYAGKIVCSFTAESIALHDAITQLLSSLELAMETTRPRTFRVLIATDSQSLLAALLSGPLQQTDPRLIAICEKLLRLSSLGVDVVLQHIFSHCGHGPNEQVDKLADEAADLDTGEQIPISHRDSKYIIRSYFKQHMKLAWIKQQQLACENGEASCHRLQVYGTKPPPKAEEDYCKTRQAISSSIRLGIHPLLGPLRREIVLTMPNSCRFCSPGDHLNPVDPTASTASTSSRSRVSCTHVNSNGTKCKISFVRGKVKEHYSTHHPGTPTPYLGRIFACQEQNCTAQFRKKGEWSQHYADDHPGVALPRTEQAEVQRKPSSEGSQVETLEHFLTCRSRPIQHLRARMKVPLTPDRKHVDFTKLEHSQFVDLIHKILNHLHPNEYPLS